MAPLSRPRAYALLHFTVLLWGATAILGKSIRIGALSLVFYRVVIVSILMAAIMCLRGVSFRLTAKQATEFLGVGALVGCHWILFYSAVKVSGVAVAVLCLSTIPFFTALIEPAFFRRTVRPYELVIGALVVVGVMLLLRFEAKASLGGYAMGIGSAFFSSAFGAWNGSLVRRERGERVTFFELVSATLTCALGFMCFGGFVNPILISTHDWVLLLALSVACTLLPWIWTLRILRTLSPYTMALSITLEPVYSLVLAFFLWPAEERLSVRFYVGTGTLLLLIFINARMKTGTASPRPRGLSARGVQR